MYCPNCGNQIAEDTRFCNFCGTPMGQAKSQSKPQPQPQPKPEPQPESKPQQPQNPQYYTVPLEEAPSRHPLKHTEPVLQDTYTEPVRPASPEEPKIVNVLEEVPIKAEKKRIRKLPILLGVIVVILVFLLLPKEEKPKQAKTEKPAAAPTEATVPAQEKEEKARYDSESFLFTHEEFVQIYTDLLEANEIPVTVDSEDEQWDNYRRRYLRADGEPVAYITSESDPETGKIILVNAGAIYEEGMTSPDPVQEDAVGILMVAACGTKAADMPQAELWKETEEGVVYATGDDHVGIYTFILETDYAIVVTMKDVEAAMEEAEAVPESTWSTEGQLFEAGGSFTFTKEEFTSFYRYMLLEQSSTLELKEPRPVNDDKFIYYFYQQDEEVGNMIIKEHPSGKVQEISITFDVEDTNNLDKDQMNAGLLMLVTAYGEMTDDQWSRFQNTTPKVSRDDYLLYVFELDGVNAKMAVDSQHSLLFFSMDLETE